MGTYVPQALKWIREHPITTYSAAAVSSLGLHAGLLYYWNHQHRSEFWTPYVLAEMGLSLAAPVIISESLRLARNISTGTRAFLAMQGINIAFGGLRYLIYDFTHAPAALKSAANFTGLTIACTVFSTLYARKQQQIVDTLHKYEMHSFERGFDFVNALTNRGHGLGPCLKSLENIIEK